MGKLSATEGGADDYQLSVNSGRSFRGLLMTKAVALNPLNRVVGEANCH